MTCHITGTARTPDGDVLSNAVFTFVRLPKRVAAQSSSVVDPGEITVTCDGSGFADFVLLPGTYSGTSTASGISFKFSVPDTATANFPDCVEAATVVPWPNYYDEVFAARDAAIAAAASIGAPFETRALLVVWAATATPVEGQIVWALGYGYRYTGTDTDITDLPGFAPIGEWYADHLTENVTPGTTDMGTALLPLLAAGAKINFAVGTYATAVTLDNKGGVLSGIDGTSTILIGLPTLGAANPVVRNWAGATVENMYITRNEAESGLTAAGSGQFVGVDIQNANKAAATVSRCIIGNCGTGIWGYGVAPAARPFNWSVRDTKIIRWRYLAMDLQGGTGLTLDNVYCEQQLITDGTNIIDVFGGYRIRDSNSVTIRNLNLHQVSVGTAGAAQFDGIDSLAIDGWHFENVKPTGTGAKLIWINRTNIQSYGLQIQQLPFEGSNQSIFEYGNAGKVVISPNLSYSKPKSKASFAGTMYQGLNHPGSAFWPTWTYGVAALTGWQVNRRTSGAVGDYEVDYEDPDTYIYHAEDSSVERDLYQSFTASGITPTGEYGRASQPNLLPNGYMDVYKNTSKTLTTAGSEEIAVGWFIAQTTGTMTGEQYLRTGSGTRHSTLRMTVATAGTEQRLYAIMPDPQLYAGSNMMLSFRAIAPVGQWCDRISINVNTGTGGSPATVSAIVLDGTDLSVQGLAGSRIYSAPFVMPDTGVTTWGTNPYMEVNFYFNKASADRTTVVQFLYAKLEPGLYRTKAIPNPPTYLSTSDVMGYAPGAGATVTQATSRTTAVTANAASGFITLFSAAGDTTNWTTFNVINSKCKTNHVPLISQKGPINTASQNVYQWAVEANDGGFKLRFRSIIGTFTDTPTFNFALKRATGE